MKSYFFVHRFSNLLVLTLLLILPAANIFGQSSSAFGTLSASANKNETKEITRPRLVSPTKPNENNKSNSDNSDSTKSKANFSPISAQAAKLESQVFEILNNTRLEKGLSPLKWSDEMAQVARQHSFNMAHQKFFSHIGKDGLLVSDRADALGYSFWRAIGENIAYNQGYDKPAEFACERWMLSQAHRENILNHLWKEVGVGVAVTDNGTYYFTQVFVQR